MGQTPWAGRAVDFNKAGTVGSIFFSFSGRGLGPAVGDAASEASTHPAEATAPIAANPFNASLRLISDIWTS